MVRVTEDGDKDFKKHFPSLKKISRFQFNDMILVKDKIQSGDYVSIYSLQEHCLDKQRVKKNLEIVTEWYQDNYEKREITPFALITKLNEVLGLDD